MRPILTSRSTGLSPPSTTLRRASNAQRTTLVHAGGFKSGLMALRALLLVLALSALAALSSSKLLVAQWGQRSIVAPHAFSNMHAEASNSFSPPVFLPETMFGGEDVSDVKSGPSTSTLYKTASGKWYLSGINPSCIPGSSSSSYYPVYLNFSGTVVDPSSSNFGWNIVDMHFRQFFWARSP